MLASGQRVAGIIGARITIIAIGGDPRDALTAAAGIPNGAGIAILAKQVVVVRDQAACSADRVATGRQADRTRAFRGRTIDNGVGIHPALIGQRIGVTQQDSVTQIPIFQGPTITVGLAIAVYRHTGTDSA